MKDNIKGEVIIKVDGLYKKFSRSIRRSLAYGSIDLFRNFIGLSIDQDALRKSEFWALEDVSFELRKGESLGIIGINGSGKSTLLRMLTGIFPPDKGMITVEGEIGALIAVGAGFHPHMSGRENVYLNGTILGMTTEEIDAKFNDIIQFADIGEFLDAPVSTYSSGMRVRLGFAIAVHREPDILLVDEILSVGDLSFRNKSLRKMREFKDKANGLIFVGHDMEQVRVLCDRVVVLDHGKVLFSGDTTEGIALYEGLTRDIRLDNTIKNLNAKSINITRAQALTEEIDILNINVVNKEGEKVQEVGLEDPLVIELQFQLKQQRENLYFSVSIRDEMGRNCIWVVSDDNNKFVVENVASGEYNTRITIDEHHLGPGVYTINYAIRDPSTGETLQKIHTEKAFEVKTLNSKLERGFVNVNEKWEIEKIA